MLDSSPEDEDFPGRLLHQAALWDNTELLLDLLAGGQHAFVNSQDSWGRTPLHAAAISDKSQCIAILLDAGADANVKCGPRGECKTALHLSAEHGHVSNVQMLLQHGASIVELDGNGMTPSDLADKAGNSECIVLLKDAADARESARLDVHAALRLACAQSDPGSLAELVQTLGEDAALIINMAPSGANTLLHTACQMGNVDVVRVLLEGGADARSHSSSQCSPLHVAASHGHVEIVRALLARYPDLVRQPTAEQRLPAHAAALNGHVDVLQLLLHFDYPAHVLQKQRHASGAWEYHMPFDVNARDAAARNSILYHAALLGNKKILDALLKFRVRATRVRPDDEIVATPCSDTSAASASGLPTRRRISNGIHAILTKLSLSGDEEAEAGQDVEYVSPMNIDMYCNNGTETALHAAVRGKHLDIVVSLLAAGANANAPIRAFIDHQYAPGAGGEDEHGAGHSSALVEACKNRDAAMVDVLLRHGARDDECRALAIAVQHADEPLAARLLAIRAHPDPEFKINKKAMTANVHSSQFAAFASVATLTYSSIFPNTPTMVNWHNLRCRLKQLRMQWLADAGLHLNAKLRQNPRSGDVALYAITRLDVSNNSLTSLPAAVFQLHSVRSLNLAANKLDRLPLPADDGSATSKPRRGRKARTEADYQCPVLEELYLQDNRLDQLPDALFRLPSLVTLVVANNKLQQLSFAMWRAPKLKELNASFNLLKELPAGPAEHADGDDCDRMSVSSSDSHLSAHAEVELECELHSDTDAEHEDGAQPVRYAKKARSLLQLDVSKHHVWSRSVEVTEQIMHSDRAVAEQASQLSSLNLAHNLFVGIPVVLPCLAVNLTRLNMSFNSLRSMSHITSYPSALKQLDLSHNQVAVWPSLPQVEAHDVMQLANLACYAACKDKLPAAARRQSGRSVRNIVLHTVCSHRRHLRLDNLRTLILTDNQLTRIQLTTDDDGDFAAAEDEDTRNTLAGKQRLIFPNLSMLDISNNNLRELPANINELSNLSCLNISGNMEISELPPTMGLLSRLWNLNTRGCSLQEPLRSMIESKKYKTMDLIGYLKSVLEDARPYARMKLMIVGVQGIGKTSLLDALRQEGVSRKKPEHWAKRMGNKNISAKTSRGTNMSTVGVDIGDWVYEKKVRNHSSHGPVVFRTWDFGGQKEYYATHQYFLSKRSLYLVVWKIADGYRGVNDILQWLVNIQARAPNAPVLIVGTHYDVVQDADPGICEEYQQAIRERFINVVDAEKCGLPRVLDTIEISCRTRHNIKLLCNLIYDTVFSLRSAGSKEMLLEQKVPATYLALEDVVGHVAGEQRAANLDPVLTAERFRSVVTAEMAQRHNRTFRDAGELHQATLFLHDNGVLLHYDDTTLKDLYFLDPQWLCDMLAHVVTIREINPFARSGIMKMDDLQHVFKAAGSGAADVSGYIVSLLNKFEVALTWDARTLLIPSLLPSEEDIHMAQMYPGQFHPMVKVRVPLRSRGWALRSKKVSVAPRAMLYRDTSAPPRFEMSLPLRKGAVEHPAELVRYQLLTRPTSRSITRLLLLSYFPCGFWSRLISRILADDGIIEIIRALFVLPKAVAQDAELARLLDVKAEWVLWQTGLQLKYGDMALFRLREVLYSSAAQYRQLKFKLKQDGVWYDVDMHASSILEIYFPVEALLIKPIITADADLKTFKVHEDLLVECAPEPIAQLLALAVEHIDVLLEDWYPTLGTRFVHTSEGRFLITRLVPCPACLAASGDEEKLVAFPPHGDVLKAPDEDEYYHRRIRQSQESCASECDSGVGPESAGSSPKLMPLLPDSGDDLSPSGTRFYSWMVEECILAAYSSKTIACPAHGDIPLSRVAPDTIFADLGARHLIQPEDIKKGRLLGRGAFGFVFKGTCKRRAADAIIDVAMKMLQPVQPGPNARQSAVIAYKAAQGKWDRDPLQYACKAYCTARQELNILLALRHPNIVPFVGVCTSPLALVLDLAPQGALDLVLRHYSRSGAKVGVYAIQAIILQVAKAIEYLHRQRIIYRDLKSENVLVWDMPPPFVDAPEQSVHIKVADYGISRQTLPSGTKGFGGTEGFMAPEIMRYNGEEEYTEKVDCFSFGMFIYELLTLHQPFEGHESVKECILEGGRPPLTYRETQYPSYFLDLMVLCWAQQPKDRPSASQIVSIASAPEFTHLCDVMSLKHQGAVVASTSAPIQHITDDGLSGSEMWLMCANARVDLLLAADRGWLQYHTMSLPVKPTACCTVGATIWIGDFLGNLHGYSVTDGFKLFSYALETEANVCVQALTFLPSLKRVACAMSNGRLFLLHSEAIPRTSTSAEGSFVMTELGVSGNSNCLCATYSDSTCHLWSGQSMGQISIYTIKEQVVAGHELLNHYQPVIDAVEVVHMVAAESSVWTYVYPGCIIYQWDQHCRIVQNKLDCSKLVPCSESLKSIAIEEHLSPSNCQVTSLTVLGDELYIGTTWGCVIIAERASLRPITIFRPYEEEVRAIVPLSKVRGANEAHDDTPLIATIGTGYRSLPSRYLSDSSSHACFGAPLQSPLSASSQASPPAHRQGVYALLWRAENWSTM